MALNTLPFKRLQHLVGLHLSTSEYPSTALLMSELSEVKKRGYLTRSELIKICRWKSARAIRHIRRNRSASIKRITMAALKTRSEQKKLSLLTSMYGVSVPMASAILTLTNPARYGVIDIRVWQLLFKMGAVASNAGGTSFTFNHWYCFLMIIRHFGQEYKVEARDIERTLFNVHRRYQRGTLYRKWQER